MVLLAATWLAAYLVGGIPFGYLVARGRGVDILAQGSGNIGATNVGRVLGLRLGILVFFLDFAKGALPVAGALWLQEHHPIHVDGIDDAWFEHGLLAVGAGLLAFLGHLLPIYLGFRGGKGVATGAGVVAVLMPLPALAAFGAWVLLTSATRYISLASIVAVVALCAVQLGMTSFATDEPRNWFCLLAALLVIARHRSNIVRLWQGTENRLPPSATLDVVARTLHVLALGLWFGGTLTFTVVVAQSVFHTFKNLPEAERNWVPRPEGFAKKHAKDVAEEQGRRLSGMVVAPIFPVHYLVQLICGIIALVPAVVWSRNPRPQGEVLQFLGFADLEGLKNQLRAWLITAALLLVLVGMWLNYKVHDLGEARREAMDIYLKSDSSDEATEETLHVARGQFGMWHGISRMVDVATILLVTIAMGLCASLPQSPMPHSEPEQGVRVNEEKRGMWKSLSKVLKIVPKRWRR